MAGAEQLVTWQGAAEADLLPLFQALQLALSRGGAAPERLTRAVAQAAARHALPPALDAAAETLASLVSVTALPQRARAVAVRLSAERGQVVAARAAEVLLGRSEAFVSPYARLAAQVLVWDSHREGAREGAGEGGATHKTFVRLRRAAEPRAHSRLEGTTLPIGQPFVIAGIACDGPGDPRLPWSERAWCGHILRYSKGG
ncbi:hypothetical protein [Deinococcus petrolearius]|uniref:Uncharacterized protein n=1 Tax=Deinococcus petrolearius TaxID=1751295 RepID=A0ABW1DDW2_9DEIO